MARFMDDMFGPRPKVVRKVAGEPPISHLTEEALAAQMRQSGPQRRSDRAVERHQAGCERMLRRAARLRAARTSI